MHQPMHGPACPVNQIPILTPTVQYGTALHDTAAKYYMDVYIYYDELLLPFNINMFTILVRRAVFGNHWTKVSFFSIANL